mmetsp:Transcript_7152/g.23504  ORF Transcript_7152/g.23504 Transcript_7152/m.23504 type:complete len:233 (+) Transcript_7152:1487-2185(+)
MRRMVPSEGAISSPKSSRVSVMGTSLPSTRFSTVTRASAIVESNLRNCSHPSSSRQPAREAGLMGTPCAASTWAAKWSKSARSHASQPSWASEHSSSTSACHCALPSATGAREGWSRTAATMVHEWPTSTSSTSWLLGTDSAACDLSRGYLRASTSAAASAAVGMAEGSAHPEITATSRSASRANRWAASTSSAEASAVVHGGKAKATGAPAGADEVARSLDSSAPRSATPC